MSKLNYQEVKQTVIDEIFSDRLIKEIVNLKLKKDWKWGIADKLLDENNYKLFMRYLSIPEPREHKFSEFIKKQFENTFQSHSYNNFNFGKKKNRDFGHNRPLLMKHGNLFHEDFFNYKGAYKKFTGSNLCPDYSLIFHRTRPKIMYRLPWMEQPEISDFEYCRNSMEMLLELKYALEGSEFYFYDEQQYKRITQVNFHDLPIFWREDEKAFEHPQYGLYHVNQMWVEPDELPNEASKVIQAFRRRRNVEINQKEIENKAHLVFVTREDSIVAGNCERQTDEMIDKIKKEYQFEGNGVNLRGDELLKIRNDHHTQKAVMEAIKREVG